MVVYAEFAIPADGFRIGRAFSDLPNVRVELDRIVPTVDAVVPYIWVQGASPEAVVRATRPHVAVDDITALDEHEGHGTLFRVAWNRDVRDAVVEIVDSELALLSGVGTATEWRFEFRAPSKGPLSRFRTNLRRNGIPCRLLRLSEVTDGEVTSRLGLTDPQFEALRLAYARGYFNEPRDVRLRDLAAEVGISRQAFSGRLRRAITNLVGESFGESFDEPVP